MNGKTWRRNTSGLAAHAKQRAERKQQQVEQAISKLLRENKPVNFNAVATSAGVTKVYHNWDQQGCVRFKLWYF